MHNIDFRLMLAALHFNENVNKEQAVTADGTPRWKVSYPKYKKGKEVVTKVTTKVTYGKFIFHLAFRQNSLTEHGSNATWNSSPTELVRHFPLCRVGLENIYTVILSSADSRRAVLS